MGQRESLCQHKLRTITALLLARYLNATKIYMAGSYELPTPNYFQMQENKGLQKSKRNLNLALEMGKGKI